MDMLGDDLVMSGYADILEALAGEVAKLRAQLSETEQALGEMEGALEGERVNLEGERARARAREGELEAACRVLTQQRDALEAERVQTSTRLEGESSQMLEVIRGE